MPRRPLTSPRPLYTIERKLSPVAQRAFNAALGQWRKALAGSGAASGGKITLSGKALDALQAVTIRARDAAGNIAAQQLAPLIQGGISFNANSPATVAWAEQNAARLIVDIAGETRRAVNRLVVESLRDGVEVPRLAKSIEKLVGLTERQVETVRGVFERAVESGLDEADAYAEMYGYSADLIKHRGMVIARTEVMRAENRGQQLLWEQAVDSGQIDETDLLQVWIVTADEILQKCDICRPMDGVTTPIGEPWETPVGPVMIPNESHPQCRCACGLQPA